MKIRWKPLLISLAIPLAVGGLSALLTMDGMKVFQMSVVQPPLSPPMWLFPIVWTTLYLLMGYASYRVWIADTQDRRGALTVYGLQLAANFLWTLIFFNLAWYLAAFLWLVLLWGLIAVTIRRFVQIDRIAGWLLFPYLLWVTFAGYLTFGVYLLN